MPTFRFRAQPALDLRLREDEEAHRALAQAEERLRGAKRDLAEAEERLEGANRGWAGFANEPWNGARQQWYRSWIVRLERERAAREALVAARAREHALALAARAQTRQRVRALERLKEKLTANWHRHVAAEEQKRLDALATARFVAGIWPQAQEPAANG